MNSTAIKTRSAMLSNVAPNLLVQLVFLARYPSKTSLVPHVTYSIKNCVDKGLVNNSSAAPISLTKVIIFGKYFLYFLPPFNRKLHFLIIFETVKNAIADDK